MEPLRLLLWRDDSSGNKNLEVVKEGDDAMRVGLGHGIVHVLPNVSLPVLLVDQGKGCQTHLLPAPSTLSLLALHLTTYNEYPILYSGKIFAVCNFFVFFPPMTYTQKQKRQTFELTKILTHAVAMAFLTCVNFDTCEF